jgi:uncharacterized protein (TIGR00251 family)
MKNTDALDIRDTVGGSVIAVKAVPGASRDRIVGVLGESLKIATAAPAEKGKANRAIAALLAEALGVDRREVRLLHGQAGPRKEFRVASLSAEQARAKLACL